ncbi:MAG: hypothetical protein LWX54_10410 [Deltaproteobacteria bacterium]|jgi:hypothetical protein|nr:hypothetical protein [Deltaproteobacteria bacterium]
MSLIPPEALNSGHCVSPFDCGKPVLNDWLVRHARQAQASIRALLAHPIDEDATRFYLRFGFVVSPLREQQLLLLLKDARRLLLTFNK